MKKIQNSIVGVLNALEKLEIAFRKEYPKEKCDFDISINPFGGKYMLMVNPLNKKLNNIFPQTVDGYKLALSNTPSNPFWLIKQNQKQHKNGDFDSFETDEH